MGLKDAPPRVSGAFKFAALLLLTLPYLVGHLIPLSRPASLCFLAAHAAASLLLCALAPPIRQPQAYHNFANQRPLCVCGGVDKRSFGFLPNAADVLSNLPFLLVGAAGLLDLHSGAALLRSGAEREAWWVLFLGVALVSLGSAYYHYAPSDATLVWDRLPMTVGFTCLFLATAHERGVPGALPGALWPAVLGGGATVFYWAWVDDLRPYLWVQFYPLLACPLMMQLLPPAYAGGGAGILRALAWYAAAKLLEHWDRLVFEGTRRVVSGHTLKHLAAAAACGSCG